MEILKLEKKKKKPEIRSSTNGNIRMEGTKESLVNLKMEQQKLTKLKKRKQTGKITEEQKQPRHPSVDEWIISVVHPHSRTLLSQTRHEALTRATTQTHLENKMQSERSQTQKATHCMIPFTRTFLSRKNHRDRTQINSVQNKE